MNSIFKYRSSFSRVLKLIGFDSPSMAVVATLLCGTVLQSFLFLFGIGCSGYVMILSALTMIILLIIGQPKTCLQYIILVSLLAFLTAYTFSYGFHDARIYHFPAEDLLCRGWNPIYEYSQSALREYVGNTSFAMDYVLFLPRINALCGALVALSIGLISGSTFLNWAFLLLLFNVAMRFCRMTFAAGRVGRILFAVGFVSTSKCVVAIIAGQNDCLLYCASMVSIFSLSMWLKEHEVRDLSCFMISVPFVALSKPAGLLYAIVLLCVAFAIQRNGRQMLWCISAVLAVIVAVGFSPFVTSTIHYSSPLYPVVSFSSAHPAMEMTHDFGGNGDALQMGYIARLCYAWFSSSLAVKTCAWWYNKPDFSPVFSVAGGVAGMGAWFRALLIISCFALALSKKNFVFWLCIVIFVVSNLMPMKYIGFARYAPCMWAIPILALYNSVYSPNSFLSLRWLHKIYSYATFLSIGLLFCLFTVRSLSFFGRSLAFESARQTSVMELVARNGDKEIKIGKHYGSYASIRRYGDIVKQDDCVVVDNDQNCSFDEDNMLLAIDDAKGRGRDLNSRYPITDTPLALVRFPWKEAFSSSVSPIWRLPRSAEQRK